MPTQLTIAPPADDLERVAAQAATLAALREARGLDVVWPSTPLSELRVGSDTLQRIGRTLHIAIPPDALDARTAAELIDGVAAAGSR